MLGIRRVGSGRADYYLSDLAAELPVCDARWVGGAADGLGLQGAVDAAGFGTLLSGRQPRTGRPLPLAGRVRVAGFDLTFSAPKSVSVLFALGGEEVARRVVIAHLEAVDGGLRYLEHHALGAVRGREVIGTTGFAGARFTHGVNRNLDPHLHSHVVVVNAVHGADGRWSASDGRGLDAHRRAGSAVYEAHLRGVLTEELGVHWVAEPGRTPEIAGVSPLVLGEFSTRGADVRMEAFRSGRSRHVAWAVTRPPKVTGSRYEDLATDWARRAEVAAGAAPLDELGRRPAGPASYDEHRFAGVLSLTPHGGAHRRDVVGAFGAAARDGVPAGSLERVTELWAPAGESIGVAEGMLTRRAVVPAPQHLRALGPRPIDPAGHETWLGAARVIDGYRSRWGLERAVEPLGAEPLASLPAARLADHLRVTRQLDAARISLGRRPPAELELGLGR